ncbi:sodium:solute symporter family transporter [Nocardioides sp.]|uniref:sodium:solute symporter family transporter n=1 Tax=Nocardioides sp. TaxID=35761 RepID=UPI002D7FAFC2|nr:hypothetical protein [Nocardioides sp.]
MSTISSQLLVTSSALVEDLYKTVLRTDASDRQLVLLGRLAVLAISLIAAALAWPKTGTVLELVAYAWAGFGASFGPAILLSLWWRKLTTWGVLAGMVTGAVTVVVWGNVDALSSRMYEILPGFVLGGLVTILISRLTWQPNAEIEAEFDEAVRLLGDGAYEERVPVA